MSHIKGIGGIFFKSQNPEQLKAWYQQHLGFPETENIMFGWQTLDNPHQRHDTIWSPFEQDTTYFSPGTASFMINYIVDDLDEALAELRAQGVQVDDRVESYDFGRFGWATDLDGNRFELWEPQDS